LDIQTEGLKHRLCENSALILSMLILAGTLLRPLLSDQSIIFTIIGICNFVLAFSFYWMLKKGVIEKSSGIVLIVISLICIMPLLLVSGGVNSQFIILLPLIPVWASFVCRNSTIIFLTLLLIVIVVVMYMFHHRISDLDQVSISNAKLVAKSFWIIISLMVSGYLGYYFRLQNSKFQKVLREYAFFDVLTKIPNRRYIQELTRKEIAQAKRTDNPLGIMLLDIDFFKKVNDCYGHDIGDVVLKKIAKQLKELIRESDHVGRFGGEEFLMIFPNTSCVELKMLGEKIVQKIGNSKIHELKGDHNITVSIGGYVSDKSNIVNEDRALKIADEALYYCKAHGRNQFYLDPENK
jgi:diguanylate cyclase (GGDEF)-like protein